MNQPSQDSLKKLQARTAAEQEKLNNLQVSTKKARLQWDTQREQIASDTEVAAETARTAIAEAVEDAKATLAELTAEIEEAKQESAIREKDHWKKIEGLSDDIVALTRDKKILQTTNNDLRAENLALTSGITVAKEVIDGLTSDETGLRLRLSDLVTQESASNEQLDTLHGNISTTKEALEVLDTEFNTNKEKYERDLSILEQKRDALIQEITDNKESQDTVRDNLAKWAKTLEEKDKNIRIREEQVNMQQKAIARNYNLLNL